MAKSRKSFLLRVDPRVHDALKRWADAEFRSLNGQVEYLLRQLLVEQGRLKEGEVPQEPPRPGRPPVE
ncbi:MAG: hypothetical protein GY747_05460 [Planctomycetes bacterium]|nr:hypothetical protein [Planctomycetota bacterium]MCP4770382.1 hypothetical protein [Planctomycetota bacterium]MCP4860526.1 hypothetical protein [Planctomycetota bacterium]